MIIFFKKMLFILFFVLFSINTIALGQILRDIQGIWAEDAIEDLIRSDDITGYQDNTFRPNNPSTRAEFAAVLFRTLNLGNIVVEYNPHYKDVPLYHWAYRPIEILTKNDVVSGFPDDTYRPSRRINRLESFVMTSKAANLPLPNQAQTNAALRSYRDAYRIPDWARPYVASLILEDLIDPPGNRIQPNRNITRAEVAALAYKLKNYLGISQSNTVSNK